VSVKVYKAPFYRDLGTATNWWRMPPTEDQPT